MNYTTEDYLTQLQQDREDLIDNLEAKGITGLTGDETFTELVPEVLNIPSGGGKYAPKFIKFTGCTENDLNYETTNLDTSNLVALTDMFSSCPNLTSLNLSGWDTSNVTLFARLCANCSNLETINLSGWDTSNGTSLSMLFNNCSKLISLDLSSFTLTSATTVQGLFSGCTSLMFIDIRNMEFSKTSGLNISVMLRDVSTSCKIIVKDATEKAWFNTNFSTYTNVKTVAEYETE